MNLNTPGSSNLHEYVPPVRRSPDEKSGCVDSPNCSVAFITFSFVDHIHGTVSPTRTVSALGAHALETSPLLSPPLLICSVIAHPRDWWKVTAVEAAIASSLVGGVVETAA